MFLKDKESLGGTSWAAREPAICLTETLEVAEHVDVPGTALHRWDQHLQTWHEQGVVKNNT